MDVKILEKEFEDFASFTAFLDERGRITIPASVRSKLRVRYSSPLSVIVKALKTKIEK